MKTKFRVTCLQTNSSEIPEENIKMLENEYIIHPIQPIVTVSFKTPPPQKIMDGILPEIIALRIIP